MWINKITPRFSDTDALQHISNISIIDWMEASRNELFKIFTPDLDPRKWNLILAKVSVDFLAQLYYQDDIEVHTGVKKLGNSSFTIEQRVFENGKKCAIGDATLVQFDHGKQKSVPIINDVRAKLEEHILAK